jgi:hypothetical protein
MSGIDASTSEPADMAGLAMNPVQGFRALRPALGVFASSDRL